MNDFNVDDASAAGLVLDWQSCFSFCNFSLSFPFSRFGRKRQLMLLRSNDNGEKKET